MQSVVIHHTYQGKQPGSGWTGLQICLNTSNELPYLFLPPSSSSGHVFRWGRRGRLETTDTGPRSCFRLVTDEDGGLVLPNYQEAALQQRPRCPAILTLQLFLHFSSVSTLGQRWIFILFFFFSSSFFFLVLAA